MSPYFMNELKCWHHKVARNVCEEITEMVAISKVEREIKIQRRVFFCFFSFAEKEKKINTFEKNTTCITTTTLF